MKFDFATTPGAEPALPLDGAPMMTVFGAGFAKSPWLKCVVVPPNTHGGSPEPSDQVSDSHPHTQRIHMRPPSHKYNPALGSRSAARWRVLS